MKKEFHVALLSACFVSLVSWSAAARADFVVTSEFQGGSSVRITYSTDTGTASTNSTVGAFTVTPSDPSGPGFEAYCVSPEVSVGWGPDVLNVGSILTLNTVDQSFFTHSAFGDVGNRLAFLLASYGGGDAASKAALALAVWRTMDQGFSFSGGGSTVANLFTQYMEFDGYLESKLYADNAKLFIVDPAGSYQNLIGITDTAFVPEPSSVISAIVGAGGMGLFGYRRTRRKRGDAAA